VFSFFFLLNNFGEYFVAGCDARLGVGIYTIASASRRASSSLKILGKNI
jgi:hypothetical protein